MSDPRTGVPPSPWSEMKGGHVRITARLLVGVAFMMFGLLWTLDNFDLLDADMIVRWWPILVATFGVAKLLGWGTRQSTFAGAMWLLAATWLMLHALGIVAHGITGLWPLALIILGGRILMASTRGSSAGAARIGGPTPARPDDHGRLKVDAVMAGVERRFPPGVFRGGEINAIFAGVEIDLREATLEGGHAELEVNAIMGGIELMLPRGWAVINQATPVLGAVEDHTQPPPADGPNRDTLILRGTAVMGGIELKN